jgi:hypothetical protein
MSINELDSSIEKPKFNSELEAVEENDVSWPWTAS